MQNRASSILITGAFLIFISSNLFAAPKQKPEEPTYKKEGTNYASFITTRFNFTSIDESEDARTYGSQLVLGTYIHDYVTVEGRAGMGFGNQEAAPGLEVGLKYWFSWYMGLAYPITDFITVHGKYGFSHVQGDANISSKKYKDIPEDFLQSSFSTSWLLSTDVKVIKGLYITGEFGSLHSDSKTQINTYHLGAGVTYEF